MKKLLLTLTAVVTMLAVVPLGAGAAPIREDDVVLSTSLEKFVSPSGSLSEESVLAGPIPFNTGSFTGDYDIAKDLPTRDQYTLFVTVSGHDRAKVDVLVDGKFETTINKTSNKAEIKNKKGKHKITLRNDYGYAAQVVGTLYYNP